MNEEKKCIIYYDVVLNTKESDRDNVYEEKKFRENKSKCKACCHDMKDCIERDEFGRDDYLDGTPFVGINISHGYEDHDHYPFKFCPFCGAPIEYELKDTYKYIKTTELKTEWKKVKV